MSSTISVHNLAPIANIDQRHYRALYHKVVYDEIVVEFRKRIAAESTRTRHTNSIMFIARVYLISAVLAVASAAPRRTVRSAVPMWHLPCGVELDVEIASWENFDKEVKDSLDSLRIQHGLTMNDYLSRDYNYLYERVHRGVDDHQYIPDWLPDRKEREIVKRLTDANFETVSAVANSVNILARFTRPLRVSSPPSSGALQTSGISGRR